MFLRQEFPLHKTATDSEGNPIAGTWDVTLSRSSRGETLGGVDLVFVDALGENSVRKERIKEDIEPLAQFTEQVQVTELTPAKVTVIPFFLTEAGTPHYCENSFTFEIQ